MKRPFFARLCFAMCSVCLVSTAFAQSSWITHNDPTGFAVDLPAAWTIAKDSESGRIIIRGMRSEQITIWPLSLQDTKLDAHGAGALLHKLAHAVDAQMSRLHCQPAGQLARCSIPRQKPSPSPRSHPRSKHPPRPSSKRKSRQSPPSICCWYAAPGKISVLQPPAQVPAEYFLAT